MFSDTRTFTNVCFSMFSCFCEGAIFPIRECFHEYIHIDLGLERSRMCVFRVFRVFARGQFFQYASAFTNIFI